MKNYLEHKADFKHKLGIKLYMVSLTLLVVTSSSKLTDKLLDVHWAVYLSILVLSYSYCLKRIISKK